MNTTQGTPLLALEQVVKQFRSPRTRKQFAAVDQVSLTINVGEVLGLVGESGCGKSTLGRLALGLLKPERGKVRYRPASGEEVVLSGISASKSRSFRREMQIVFQDPYGSLNPRWPAWHIVAEPLMVHQGLGRARARAAGRELMGLVELRPEDADRFPHEFSGGQRQRLGIARALALRPRFVVADEPVSSLDVSIQAQIVNLLLTLREEVGFSCLFIAHDLSVVKQVSDRVAVMYAAKVMEVGDCGAVLREPSHPYTRLLAQSVPVPDPAARKGKAPARGEPPSLVNPPSGCRFHPRCPEVMELCPLKEPRLLPTNGRLVACHLYG